jgi:hypothetical protein
MTDYHTPTVVQPTIPNIDMTALERLILGRVFDTEADGDGLYFFAETGPNDVIAFTSDELTRAVNASAGIPSTALTLASACIEKLDHGDTHVELDLSVTSWEPIFQDIVRRSRMLEHIIVVSAFTCTKMRPDGFGGMAVVITADAIRGRSTNDIIEDLLTDDRPATTDRRMHILVRLREDDVREQVKQAIEADPDLTSICADAVTDQDIDVACHAVVLHSDLSEEQDAATFRAAITAIREAERRTVATAAWKSPVAP